jgi:hypothetical protein
MLVLELNDAELVLGNPGVAEEFEQIAAEPGCVGFAAASALTGQAAAARSRLQPLLSSSRHWQDLSAVPLGRAHDRALTNADLAYEQLRALLARSEDSDRRLIIALPAGYTREQLGLLLGVAQEAGASEVGLVDAAVAACGLQPIPAHVLHLEMFQHRSLATAIEQSGDTEGARRAQFEVDIGCGVARLEQLWIELIAGEFVRRTRFDPLHEAASEQLLADGLTGWLDALAVNDSVPVSLAVGDNTLQVTLPRGQWLAAAEPVYASLLQLVQRARPAGRIIELRLGARLAKLPGLLERFEALGSCTVVSLPPAAAARGALRFAGHILRGTNTALLCQLPLPLAPRSPDAGNARTAIAPATHVLHGGRAIALSAEPLLVGCDLPSGARGVALPRGLPGVSRVHCRLQLCDGIASVEDNSTYGTFVNDERVHGRLSLARGDRLRLGSPGITLEMIEVVS